MLKCAKHKRTAAKACIDFKRELILHVFVYLSTNAEWLEKFQGYVFKNSQEVGCRRVRRNYALTIGHSVE